MEGSELRYPDELDPGVHRDRTGTGWRVWARRALLGLFALISLAGLLDVFGQQPSTATAAGPGAAVAVQMPGAVRGGLIFQMRVTIEAKKQIDSLRLVMDPSFYDGMTFNSMTPGAVSETDRDGRPVYQYGTLPKGTRYVIWFQCQANPTNVGRRGATLEVDDGTTPLAAVHRTLTVFP
jgi:hypothetical protein